MKPQIKSGLFISILFPLAVGTLSSLISGNIPMYYSSLNKPGISPPSFVFPIIWTLLYILMGISSYIIYHSNSPNTQTALYIYLLQLFFNFGWSIIFFGLSQYLFAFLWLLVLIALICIMIINFYKISPLAAYLQIPYLIWCIFAAYLNFYIYLHN